MASGRPEHYKTTVLGVGDFKYKTNWYSESGTKLIDSNVTNGFVVIQENSSGIETVYHVSHNVAYKICGGKDFTPISKEGNATFRFTIDGYSHGKIYSIEIPTT